MNMTELTKRTIKIEGGKNHHHALGKAPATQSSKSIVPNERIVGSPNPKKLIPASAKIDQTILKVV